MSSNKPAFDAEKQEPKENDKCMETANNDKEESEWRRRLGDFSKRTKDFASNRYKVVLLVLCILLFVFFIIIIALAVKIGTNQNVETAYCSSDDCLRAAANVVSKMNDTFNPCNDFYEYSCGHWIEEHSNLHQRGSYGVIDQVQDEVYKRVRGLLDLVLSDTNEHSPEGKAKLFYSTCMKMSDIKYWSLNHFRQWVTDIGGWLLININKPLEWNRNDVLLRMHVNYGVHPFFKFAVSPDDRNPWRKIIKISPFGLGLPERSFYFEPDNNKYVRAYKDFMKDIVREFGVTPSYASRFADDMYNYEKRIAQIIPPSERMLDVNNEYQVITIRQLGTITPTVEWHELLQAYYPNVKILESTEVGILSKEYFSSLSGLLSTTDDIALNNYMMWHLVLYYLPHFPDNFKTIANKFYQSLEGMDDITVPSENRWKFCLGQTVHYLGHALSSIYVQKYFDEGEKNDVERTIDNILVELSGKINSFPWLRSVEDKEMAQDKVRLLNISIGYPEFILNKENLELYYKSLQVKATSHIENVRSGENFLRRKEEEVLNRKFNNSQSYAVDVKANYEYSGNSLVIPAGLLNSLIYERRLPPAIKYGSMAGYISNKLMQMFDIKGINYERYGRLEPWLSNRSREYYEEGVDCLLQNINVNDPKLFSNLTVLEIMTEIASVKYSYLANKKRGENEDLLPGVKRNHDQVFFMAYAQSLCQVSQPGKVTVLGNPKYELRNKIRVMNTLQQLPEFADAFGCTDESLMKSKRQCDIW